MQWIFFYVSWWSKSKMLPSIWRYQRHKTESSLSYPWHFIWNLSSPKLRRSFWAVRFECRDRIILYQHFSSWLAAHSALGQAEWLSTIATGYLSVNTKKERKKQKRNWPFEMLSSCFPIMGFLHTDTLNKFGTVYMRCDVFREMKVLIVIFQILTPYRCGDGYQRFRLNCYQLQDRRYLWVLLETTNMGKPPVASSWICASCKVGITWSDRNYSEIHRQSLMCTFIWNCAEIRYVVWNTERDQQVYKTRDSSVGIATRLRAGRGLRIFLFTTASRTALKSTQLSM
jgi:hypothetical protein